MRSAGRANSSKLTIELTGLPGRPNTGTPAVEQTEGERLGRLDRDLHPAHVGDARQHGLDHVVVAHADPAAGDDGVTARRGVAEDGFQRGLVVADHAEVDRLGSGVGDETEQHRQVALADLAGAEIRAVGDELVAGGEHGDAGPPGDGDGAGVDAGQHAGDRGRHHRAWTEQRRPGGDVVAGATHGRADADGGADPHPVPTVEPLGVLHHHDRVGASRHRRAGHDPDRLPFHEHVVGGRPGGHLVDDAQLDRHRGDVGTAHGVPVDGRVDERRHVLRGDDRGGEGQPASRVDREFDDVERGDRGQHVGPGLGRIDHS